MIPATFNYWKCMVCWMFYLLLMTTTEALGAESAVNWRPTYDLVMRWLNFGILVLLFFKYVRKPLSAFLNGKSRQVKESITKVEEEKEVVMTRIHELKNEQKKAQEHMHQIRDRLLSQGEQKKKKIIDDAKKESHLLMGNAKQKIKHEISSARNTLQMEMVDQAIALSMQRLPQLMTDQDAQNSLKLYLDGIHSLPKS